MIQFSEIYLSIFVCGLDLLVDVMPCFYMNNSLQFTNTWAVHLIFDKNRDNSVKFQLHPGDVLFSEKKIGTAMGQTVENLDCPDKKCADGQPMQILQ